jgi:hypothetical protein
MISSTSSARRALVALLLAGAALGGCSGGGSHFESDYVSPIAATPAPQPAVPAPSGGPAPARRMPLLPPVPGDEAAHGLPPVTTAALLPPTVR